MADPWYPPAPSYYVPPPEQGEYPVRQGDLFGETDMGNTESWLGFVVTHPSCEIQVGKANRIQVARVSTVAALPDEFQRVAVTYGYREQGGKILIAFANTFWMPPAAAEGTLSQPLFADFRQVASVELALVAKDRRVQAMTHDTRVYFIRRKILFRYRWHLSVSTVREQEALRIGSDPTFEGPRPDWAHINT